MGTRLQPSRGETARPSDTVTILPGKTLMRRVVHRVRPKVLRLVRGHEVVFRHGGAEGGVVFVPHPEIFEEEGYVHPLAKTTEGFMLTLHVREDAPRVEGEFDYAVFSNDLQRFGVANSPPRMILDP